MPARCLPSPPRWTSPLLVSPTTPRDRRRTGEYTTPHPYLCLRWRDLLLPSCHCNITPYLCASPYRCLILCPVCRSYYLLCGWPPSMPGPAQCLLLFSPTLPKTWEGLYHLPDLICLHTGICPSCITRTSPATSTCRGTLLLVWFLVVRPSLPFPLPTTVPFCACPFCPIVLQYTVVYICLHSLCVLYFPMPARVCGLGLGDHHIRTHGD